MNRALKQNLQYWLREASDHGQRGLGYDQDLSYQDQLIDWIEFENTALEDIENFLENVGIGADF